MTYRSLFAMVLLASSSWVAIACDEDDPSPHDLGIDQRRSTDARIADQAAMDQPQGEDDLTKTDDLSTTETSSHDQQASEGKIDAGPSYPAPLSYWSMDSADIASDTLKDLMGTHHGTIVGATADSQGQVGQALALDGQQDHIDLQDVLNSTFAGADKSFSVAMWIKPGSVMTNNVLFGKTADTACDPDEDQRMWFSVLKADSKPAFSYQTPQAGNVHIVGGTSSLNVPGTWYHLIFVYQGSVDSEAKARVTIYRDGVAEVTTVASAGAFPFDLQAGTAHLAFGVRLSSSGAPCIQSGASFFHGSVDELALWNVALSATEAAAIYQQGMAQAKLVP